MACKRVKPGRKVEWQSLKSFHPERRAAWAAAQKLLTERTTGSVLHMKLKVENIYEDGETVVTYAEVDVPPPPAEGSDARADWEEDHIYPVTGTGKTEGDAGYFVEVVDCDDPALIGTEFEFGT